MVRLSEENQNLLGMLLRKYYFFKRNTAGQKFDVVVRECVYATCSAIIEAQGIRLSEASSVAFEEVEGDYNGVPSWYRTLRFYNGDEGSFEYTSIDKIF